MANIEIDREHTLERDEVRKRLAEMEAKLRERYGVTLTWRGGDAADVKGTGVSGELALADKRISIRLKLGLMMKPMAGKIRDAMEKQLDKALV